MATLTEKMSIRASVIIVSYNSRIDLKRCLPSLLPSLSSLDEVIVVDNASSDGSAEWLAETYPSICLIRSAANIGFGGGNNIGAYNANGKYLAFLNPDTQVEPGWLDSLILALENEPIAGLATSKILLLNNPDRINTCGNDMHISGITLCRGMNEPRNAFSEQIEVSAISGTSFIIRKDLFTALGGFDEHFFLYMEDTDLSLRARLAGYRCLYIPESIVHHDYTLTFGPQKTYYQERNRYIMLLKCFRWRTLVILLPTILLSEVVTWCFSFLHDNKNLNNKIRAYKWVIQNRTEILQERQRVQAYRRVSDQDLLRKTNYRLEYEQTVTGPLRTLPHLIFDPFFFIFQKFALIF
jgi:GT2 family glycosyltransferase